MRDPKIVLIGFGKVGSALYRRLYVTDVDIVQIYNRSTLEERLETPITPSLKAIKKDAEIYIIAISDDSIADIASELTIPRDAILLHTGGNKSIDILKPYSQNYGILYPFQSFTKGLPIDFSTIPILIEANNKSTLQKITSIANLLSDTVIDMDESQRKQVNLAGVFVNNFVNAIYAAMYARLESSNIDPSLLLPIIQYTSEKLNYNTPIELQTGPALRDDENTIKNQLKLIAQDPLLTSLYSQLTELIQRQHST